MEILIHPNSHLRTKTKAVDKVTPELATTAKEMYKVMREANGIGLAGNQVGLDISIIVLENEGKPLILFNPVILKRSPKLEAGPEGCLSFPGIIKTIKRSTEVTIRYRDENNKMQYRVLRNLQARALIHEFEHLQGKLLEDHNDETTSST